MSPAKRSASSPAKEDRLPEPANLDQRAAIAQISSSLLGHVAHDMGTPVSALRGYLRMLLNGRSGALTDEQREYIGVALESADRLSRLAIRLGKAPDFIEQLEAETFDIRKAWLETVRANESALEAKAITLNEHPPADPFMVVGDGSQLRHVLDVVLAASIEFVKPGAAIAADFSHGRNRAINIQIRLPRPGASEIPPDAEDPLSGDLSAADNIVFLHGGDFSFERQAEAGPTFNIKLPEAPLGHL